MKFFYILTQSISSKQFYGELIGGKHPIGFIFLAKVQVLVALFLTIVISIQVSTVLPTLEQKMSGLLPEGAEIVLKDGKLSTNINPVLIPFTPQDQVVVSTSTEGFRDTRAVSSALSSSVIPANLVVLDITTSTTEESLRARDTLMLITQDGIVYGEPGKRVSSSYFTEISSVNLVIDRAFLTEKAIQLKQSAKFLPFILFIGVWVVLYAMALFTALMYAIFVYTMFKIMKIGKGFKVAFSVAAYSRGFALLLGAFALLLPILMIPTLSILIQLLFITLMIRPARLKNII